MKEEIWFALDAGYPEVFEMLLKPAASGGSPY